jgi:hypothetical protein
LQFYLKGVRKHAFSWAGKKGAFGLVSGNVMQSGLDGCGPLLMAICRAVCMAAAG